MLLDAILTIGLVLSGLLLVFTTYAALVGLAGSVTGRSYERCPRCHEHYLADRSGAGEHQCAVARPARVQHASHSFLGLRHHAHAGRR